MKILIAGDTHGNDVILEELVKQYPNMDKYLHTGDSLSYPEGLLPFVSVMGNCDFYPFDEKILIRNCAGNLLMKHLPYFSAKERESAYLLIHGHTHIYKISEESDHLIISPGSLTRPRDGSNGTYIILSINENKINIEVIDTFSKSVLISKEVLYNQPGKKE